MISGVISVNCPNCNANEIINGRCQYCGTFFPEKQEYVHIPIVVKGEILDEVITQMKKNRSVII